MSKVVDATPTTDLIPFKEFSNIILPLGSVILRVSLIISFLTFLLDNSFTGTRL